IESFGDESRAYLLDNDFIPDDLRPSWMSIVDQALQAVRRAYAGRQVAMIRLHGDCHGGNVLWTDAGPHFVDFDDARTGPAVQDLWMLLSGDRRAMEAQLRILIEAYETFRAFDRRELALIEPLRTLRLLHYSACLARRFNDPAFPIAFPWFNTQRYWQDRILELREQVALMNEAPLLAQGATCARRCRCWRGRGTQDSPCSTPVEPARVARSPLARRSAEHGCRT